MLHSPLAKLGISITLSLILIGCGGGGGSSPSPVNTAPVAKITLSTPAEIDPTNDIPETTVGQTLMLNGSTSSDAEDDPMAFEWSLVTSPGSSAIQHEDEPLATFTPNAPGTYIIELNVFDPKGLTSSKQFTFNAFSDSCSGSCLRGQFINEPVEGLRYQCEFVKARTDNNGFFKCPRNSEVIFFLQADKGIRRITLGRTPFNSQWVSNSTGIFQVSPLDLVPGGSALPDLNGADETTTRIINIRRLLQSMAVPGPQLPSPLMRLKLDPAAESAINRLSRNLDPIDLGSGFSTLFKPVADSLAATGRLMPSASEVRARLEAGRGYNTQGVYEASPMAITSVITPDATNGMVATNGSLSLVEGAIILTDRENKSIGLGLEWKAAIDPMGITSPIRSFSQVMTETSPVNDLLLSNEQALYLPNGNVKSGPLFQAYTAGSNYGIPSGSVEFTQGRLYQHFLLGHPMFYRNLFGLSESDPIPDFVPARWIRRDEAGLATFTGHASIIPVKTIAPYFDPNLWKTAASISSTDSERRPVFPLHLEMTLNNADINSCPGSGCEIGRFGLSILPNGNIITDLNNDCGSVSTALKDNGGVQEYRLGAVSSAFRQNDAIMIAPLILMSRIPGLEQFQGVTLGFSTSAGGGAAKVDITHALSGNVAITDNSALDSTGSATWINYPGFFKAVSMSAGRDSAMKKSTGKVAAVKVQSCYHPAAIP